MVNELNHWFPKETGGVLIGHWTSEAEVVISDIVGPGPKAEHSRYSFTPDNDFHIQEIARYFHASEGVQTYVGDWHTHPDAEAYLSPLDRKTLRKIAYFKPAQTNRPLMLVLGTKPFELKGWCYEKRGRFKKDQVEMCRLFYGAGKKFNNVDVQ